MRWRGPSRMGAGGGGVRGGEAGQLGLFCGDLKSWLRSPRSLPGRCESFKDWKPSCLRKGRVRDRNLGPGGPPTTSGTVVGGT